MVNLMIDWLYTFRYRSLSIRKANGHYAFMPEISVRMYALGEKYVVPDLCNFALSRLRKEARWSWSMPCFGDAIKFAYQTTPSSDRRLRDILVEASSENVKTLLQENEWFRELMREVPDFGIDLVIRTSNAKVDRGEENPARKQTDEVVHLSKKCKLTAVTSGGVIKIEDD